MIPSRGLQWSSQSLGIGRRRIGASSIRHFSSSNVQHRQIRSSPLTSIPTSLSSKASARSQLYNTNLILKNGAGIRFASTTPVVAATPPSSSVVPEAPLPSPAEIPQSFDDWATSGYDQLLQVPEQIGYLKSLGLDFGWGPTSVMQWVLEHTHVYLGTPWWASIVITAVIVRVALFKPYMMAADNSARMLAIKPETDKLREKMTAASRDGNHELLMEVRRELQILNSQNGVKITRGLIAPLAQGFAGFGAFFLLRAMSKIPVPGLETGGILWFYNLAVPDTYFLLPMATAFLGHWMIRMGGETGQSTMSPQAQKAFMYGFPALTIIFTWWLPAAVQLTFLTSSLLALAQSLLLRSETFRRFVGVPPIPRPLSDTPAIAYKGNLKIATPRPLSISELDSRYSSSKPTPILGEDQPPNSKTKALLEKLRTPYKDVATFTKDMMVKANTNLEGRRVKSERNEAEKYEKKRQAELKEQADQLAQRRKAERAARKRAKEEEL